MKRDRSVVLRSTRGSRVGEGGPPSRTFLYTGAFLRFDDFFRSSFRRAAAATDAKRRPGFQTSTRTAYAPRIVAERLTHL
jgi:hypothetical protein